MRCGRSDFGVARHDQPDTERGKPRIDEREAALRLSQRNRSIAPECGRDHVIIRHVANDDVCAQLVHRQPLGEFARPFAARLEEIALTRPHDEEVEQDLALRRQQTGIESGRRVEQRHLVGDEPTEQLFRIRTGHRHRAAIRQDRNLAHGSRLTRFTPLPGDDRR
jgi:hypothetical protein